MALNARYANGTVVRWPGLAGLPITTLTSVAVDGRGGEWWRPAGTPPRIWLGTPTGAILFDPAASQSADVWLADATPPARPVLQQRWRYFNGPRWLPVSAANATFAAIPAGGIASVGNTTWVVTAGGGVAVLTAASWQLADKAAWYEAVLPRHDRLGLVADCTLSSFGNVTSCTNTPCESNGLWTGIQLAAEAARYAATGDPAALAATIHYGLGMQLLLNVTGAVGYPARSVVAPWEPAPAPGGWWFPSPDPAYAGWWYMSNTSSDSTTGHMYGYGMAAALGGPAATAGVNTTALLLDILDRILAGNYTLIDPTGVPTRWGNWNPGTLNDNRDWSDGRGVNSMQMLAFAAAGAGLAVPGTPASAAASAALTYLTAPGQDYGGNVLNAKIEVPTDDNFSDDELTFLPYALFCAYAPAAAAAAPALPPAVAASLQRTFAFVRAYRPALWSVMYLSCTAGGAPVNPTAAATDAWWNLATWPLELIDWPIANSQRADVRLNPEPNRNLQYGTQSATVLPANERGQYRWNADPYALDTPGVGLDEYEPGAWLLPYWLARAAGLIAV